MPAVAKGYARRVCGRFANAKRMDELAMELAATVAEGAQGWQGSHNITPGRDAPILVEVPAAGGGQARRLGLARFGLTGGSASGSASGNAAGHAGGSAGGRAGKGPQLVFNARAETLGERRLFAEAAARRRCVVPVTGFFEWSRPQGAHTHATPHFIYARDAPLLHLAALYEVSHDPETDAKLTRFAIVTVPATEPVRALHDRMPLMVPVGLLDSWLLRGELDATHALEAVGRGLPPALATHAVSRDVGDGRIDEARLVEPVDPTLGQSGWLDFDGSAGAAGSSKSTKG